MQNYFIYRIIYKNFALNVVVSGADATARTGYLSNVEFAISYCSIWKTSRSKDLPRPFSVRLMTNINLDCYV
jgi:hypothetical protein